MSPIRLPLLALAVLILLPACGQNDDEAGAKQLFAKINEGAGYRAWERPVTYPRRTPSFTAHSDEVEIFVNPVMAEAARGPTAITSWPVGSIVVKESYSVGDDKRTLLAMIERRADGWFWAELNDDNETIYSGKPSICINCHNNREKYSDWVYALEFPR